jgi:bifunctional non-homologous end joining protein LigD
MIWDRGTYTAAATADDPVAALREGYRNGELKFVLKGKRLKGSWVLVRTRGPSGGARREQWLLIKHRDEAADRTTDPVAEYLTSAKSGRTMEEIAEASSEEAG